MKKKILFLGVFPPPNYGASILCQEIMDFLSSGNKVLVEKIKLNYSKEMEDVGKINFTKIKGIFKVRRQILEKIDKFRPNFVYFAPATKGLGLLRDTYFASIVKRKKIPIVFHIHSRISKKILERKQNKILLKKALSGEKAIVLGNELVNDVNWIIPKKNIYILPNAIKNNLKERDLKKLIRRRKKNEKPKILFLSNMIRTKGWPKLLEACKILNEDKLDYVCNFVGAWPSEKEEKEFKKFVNENNLDKMISFLGKKSDEKKYKIFEESDIFVFPTEYELETFGLVIAEAMMYAIPVIANGIATIPSTILHGKTGFVLEENSPKEIAFFLEKLIKNPELRAKIGMEGRKRFLDKFEIKKYEGELLKILMSQ